MSSSTFGAGDTVGCGILYPPMGEHGFGAIFYTKNGSVVAEYSFSNGGVLANAWYPVVGTDCHSPIEMNCGSRPFTFDVIRFERHHLDRLGISHEYLSSKGVLSREVSPVKIHPLVSEPWSAVRGRRVDASEGLCSAMHSVARVSFFDSRLLSDTVSYNRYHPEYVDSSHDAYARLHDNGVDLDILDDVVDPHHDDMDTEIEEDDDEADDWWPEDSESDDEEDTFSDGDDREDIDSLGSIFMRNIRNYIADFQERLRVSKVGLTLLNATNAVREGHSDIDENSSRAVEVM